MLTVPPVAVSMNDTPRSALQVPFDVNVSVPGMP